MNFARHVQIVVSVLSVLAIIAVGRSADDAPFTPVLIKGHLAHPTRLLAKVKPVAQASAHASTLAAQGLRATRGFELMPGLVVLDTDPQAQAMAAAATGATNAAMQAAQLQMRIEALRASGLFEFVEPDYLYFADATPNDSAFTNGTLWGLRNTGQYGGTVGVDVDAVRAWDITTGSTNVIVGVIDSGIRYTHVDLAANMWRNSTEVAGNGVDDDGNGYVDDVFGINAIANTGNPMDDDGHGTHVAGTIGAAANNGQPHVGVAWNVRLMALKFLRADGGGATSDAIECVNYAVAKGAKILNNSWGGGPRSQALRDAITAAQNQGVLFVASAGNEGLDNDYTPHYPSNYDLDNIISVAAIDHHGIRPSFSDFGLRTVDLGAPGVAIYSTISTSDTSYDTVQGTSMAAPHVSGVAALIRAQYPAISVADLRDRLLNTTAATPSLQGITVTGGRVNAYQALTRQGDGQLEVSMSPLPGTTLYHGRATMFTVRVTDLVGVTGATVTGTIGGGGAITFLDNGVAPDVVANDSRYTAMINVPATGAQLTLSVNASAPGKTAAQANATYTLQAPPPNDNFASRIALSFNNGSTTANNTGATVEPGEPMIAGESGGASLWWTWTAPANTSVTVSTEGSNFDTLLGVYTGSAVNALTEIASNDDISGPNQPSKVTFNATAGTVYQIVVDGWEGKTGSIALSIATSMPPVNDRFARRLELSGAAGTTTGTAGNSTMEPGEPNHLFEPQVARGSVWWTWTAPATDTAVFRVSNGDRGQPLLVAVYAGVDLDGLGRLPTRATEGNTDIDISATVAVNAGETYSLVVASAYDAPRGDFTLSWQMVNRPPNDRFADCALLVGTSAQTMGTTYAATREIGEPRHGVFADGASVWWTWVAPADGTATLVVPEGDVVTAIAAYTGSSVASLTVAGRSLASSDDSAPRRLAFPTTAGTSYYIAIDAPTWAKGPFTLNLGWGLAPANDQFAARTLISGTLLTVTGTNVGAGREAAEPAHPQGSGNTVWWSWTAPWTGTAVVGPRVTSASGYAVLAVYTGDSLSSLEPVWNSSGSPTSVTKMFRAVAGTSYHIALDGFAGFTGPLGFALGLHEAPGNDQFADRRMLVGTVAEQQATHAYATGEPDEPLRSSAGARGSVWWTWTAPATGATTIAIAEGSPQQTSEVTVFEGSELPRLNAIGLRYQFRTEFAATAGNVYQIRVTTTLNLGTAFTVYLHQGGPPVNDNFSNRSAIGASGMVTASNRSATDEAVEWFRTTNSSRASTWWTWTAPTAGRVGIATTGSSFRALLEVYTGSSLEALTPVVNNRPALTVFNPLEYVFFDAVAGMTYQIVVDGFLGEVGDISLKLAYATPPANDAFAGRVVIVGTSAELHGSNFAASKEPNDPGNAGANVWWTWTAPASGMAAVLTEGSDFDTLLWVFRGTDSSALQFVGYNDNRSVEDACSLVVFPATAGTTYQFLVGGAGGMMGSIAFRLLTGQPPVAPQVSVRASTVTVDSVLVLSADVGDVSGYSYQWLQNGSPIAGAVSFNLILSSAQLFNAGSYSLRLSNVFGAAVSNAAVVEVADLPPSNARLTNLSTRALALTGDNVLIPGFVVAGPGNKQLLIRAVGPTLAGFGVPGTLADPRLTLKRWNGAAYDDVASNDNWGTNTNTADIITKSDELFAFPLNTGSADAALLVDLAPGQYSAVAAGAGTQTGIAIVELYDADTNGGTARLINISNRGFVGAGDSIMIPGFVVSDEGPKTLLIRAVGPTLANFGVAGVLADPTLTIYRRNQTAQTEELILTNDDWSIGPGASRTRDVAAQIQAFALPEGSNDAAFVVTLNPGIYTVHARGANDSTGVALVEVYAVP